MNVEQFIGHLAGRFAQGVRPDDPVALMYAKVMRQFSEHALSKWAAVSAAGVRCAVGVRNTRTGHQKLCGEAAAGSCVVCHATVCVAHAMVSSRDGSLVCDGCVLGFRQAYSGASERSEVSADSELQRKHLETLGLEEGATQGAVKHAFKELAKRHHPDGKSGHARELAEARFKVINEAYQWLRKHLEEDTAAA
jgi:hypothetical protein